MPSGRIAYLDRVGISILDRSRLQICANNEKLWKFFIPSKQMFVFYLGLYCLIMGDEI